VSEQSHTPSIAFFDTKSYDREYFSRENQPYGFDIRFFENRLTAESAIVTRDFDCVCIFVNDVLDAHVAESLKAHGVRLIALRCSGYNNVDFKALAGEIPVVRVPAYSPHAVAEHAVALMLTLNRKTHRAYYRTRDNNFSLVGLIGFDMYGKSAGIIGTGKIGKIVCQILRGFGMEVLAYDLYPDKEWAANYGVEYTSLTDLYRRSDIISLHCPLTPDNLYMVNKGTLSLMKDSAMIVNTGRGMLINTSDLLDAIKNRRIGSAALDVYEEETDYFFEDRSTQIMDDDILARLLTFPNVLVTSHQAFFTYEALTNIARTTLGNIHAFFRDEELTNQVVPE
jgi:D-lactate dehydrogenase